MMMITTTTTMMMMMIESERERTLVEIISTGNCGIFEGF